MATVLVVDDARLMRSNIKKMLDHLGHVTVGEAGAGLEAIEKYKLLKPELVTMDITMPPEDEIKDGIDAVKGIIKYDPKAKIIMVTSHGEKDQVIKAIQAGALSYILKPLQIEKIEKFEEVVNKVLN